MGKFKDLTGQKFGKLTVVAQIGKKGNAILWRCKCECGNDCEVVTADLNRQHNVSCGCNRGLKHGKYKTRLYRIYNAMKERCYNQHTVNYHLYGGRGITICKEWLNDFNSFYEWALNNGYKENLSIDRKDTSGNYEPSNCRWITNKEQQSNKRNNVILTYDGITLTAKQWAEKLDINYQTLISRIYRGKPIEEILKK